MAFASIAPGNSLHQGNTEASPKFSQDIAMQCTRPPPGKRYQLHSQSLHKHCTPRSSWPIRLHQFHTAQLEKACREPGRRIKRHGDCAAHLFIYLAASSLHQKNDPRLERAESVVNLIVTLYLVSHCSVFYDHLRLVPATPTVALKMTSDMHGKATRG